MKPTLQASRSIAAEFATRLYLPILISVAIVATVLLAVSIYLVTLSAWWIILLVIISLLTLFAAGALTVSWVFIRIVAPLQTKAQKKLTKTFVDKFQRVSEVVATPKFVLFFQIMRDVINPSQDGFVISATGDASSLKNDFAAIRNSFSK